MQQTEQFFYTEILTILLMVSLVLSDMINFVIKLIVLLKIITSEKYLLITKILITFVTGIEMTLTSIYLLPILRKILYGYKLFNTSHSYFFY